MAIVRDPLVPGSGRSSRCSCVKRRQLNVLDTTPWSSLTDQPRFVQPIDRLCQRVVVRIADTPNRWADAHLSKAIRVADHHILNATVTVMDKSVAFI